MPDSETDISAEYSAQSTDATVYEFQETPPVFRAAGSRDNHPEHRYAATGGYLDGVEHPPLGGVVVWWIFFAAVGWVCFEVLRSVARWWFQLALTRVSELMCANKINRTDGFPK